MSDINEFLEEFAGESDRAAVILSAIEIDNGLKRMLEKYLFPCANSTDPLFSNNGPLGTFSSKIDMCFRLGLIDAEVARTVHLLRKIRNDFAHEVHGKNLKEGRQKDRIKELAKSMNELPAYGLVKSSNFSHMDEVRAEFTTTVAFLVIWFNSAAEKLRQSEPTEMVRYVKDQ